MLTASPPRPPLSFRVGITGTRDRLAAEAARPAVAQILTLVRDEILRLAATKQAKEVYYLESDHTIRPKFVFVSPLAEGADRAAAEEALRLGYSLKAVLPFAQAEYENDFPDAVDEFRWLIERADSVLKLDGDGKYRDRSYEAVGRFVVNNSDLLIAVWDGEPANGRGGTGDILELAVDLGVPVVHLPTDRVGEVRLIETRLHLQANTAEIGERTVDLEASEVQLRAVCGGEPRLIETWLHLRRPDLRPYPHRLRQLIRRTVLPPPAPGRWWFDPRVPALQKYLQEKVPGAGCRRVIFRGFGRWVIRRLTALGSLAERLAKFRLSETSDLSRSAPLRTFAQTVAEEWWTKAYEPADKLSPIYGDRYRSCYVAILVLAFVALMMAVLVLADPGTPAVLALAVRKTFVVLGLPVPEKRIMLSSLEFACLLLIFGFWLSNLVFRWHQRWISYRLLAELCRKQRALARLGRSLPRWEIEHLGSEADNRDEAWVGWYFTAIARAAPFPRGDLGGDALEHARQVGLALLHEQIEYHVDRGKQGRAGLALRGLGLASFVFTVVCVVLELKHYSPCGVAIPWSIPAAILPTAAAFCFGIGAYAEFELLANQSALMERAMRNAWDELEEAGFDRPLSSRDLGTRIFRAATLMMQDIHGWAQLFRVKHVETH